MNTAWFQCYEHAEQHIDRYLITKFRLQCHTSIPSLILRTTVPEYQELLLLAYEQRDKHDGLLASNMGGWHSPLQPIPEVLPVHAIPEMGWRMLVYDQL